MNIKKIEIFLKSFNWSTLQRMYGNPHPSIIGLISSEWINQSESNSVLDGAPASITGKGRTNQQHADVLLCKDDKPYVAVEVENNVSKYSEKIDSLWNYLHNNEVFRGMELGLLIMTNGYADETVRLANKHNWTPIKAKVKKGKYSVALVSIEKSKATLDDSALGRLRKPSKYYPWDIVSVDYWLFDGKKIREGNLWKK